MRCEVLEKAVLTCERGSIVEVSERQFELARRVLKPLDTRKKDDEEVLDVPVKENRKKKQ